MAYEPAPAWKNERSNPLNEVVDVIELPLENQARQHVDPNTLALDPKIIELVHEYVSFLAEMYPDHPFHNFEHASSP
jgi:hypothetical protein